MVQKMSCNLLKMSGGGHYVSALQFLNEDAYFYLFQHSLERFLKPAKKVTFQFLPSDNEVLQAMYRVMMGGGINGAPSTGQKFVSQ